MFKIREMADTNPLIKLTADGKLEFAPNVTPYVAAKLIMHAYNGPSANKDKRGEELALDATLNAMNAISDLMEYDLIQVNKKLLKTCEVAIDSISSVYQQLGAKAL